MKFSACSFAKRLYEQNNSAELKSFVTLFLQVFQKISVLLQLGQS